MPWLLALMRWVIFQVAKRGWPLFEKGVGGARFV